MKKVLWNAKVVLFDSVLYGGGVEIEDKVIVKVFRGEDYDHSASEVIDCAGMFLSPGFIDIHLHGGGGADVMDGTEEAVKTVINAHAKHGTTALLPSTLSSTQENI
ncbi:MAG: N-acetylglucosamine-6-phosphate deacetylase, partial [Christensenella hongkongensis]|nr:N-acetylglucosamine-6-phosphate deacetylase [Christensenella hongkongensis]